MKVDIKELLTLPTTIMAALSLASGILLFSPIIFLEKLFMLDFREKYGFIIGIVFLVSISILVVNLIYTASKSVSNAKARKNFYANASKRLRALSPYQKGIIYGLYIEENRTHELPLHDGAIVELQSKYMIGKVSGQYLVYDLNNAMIPFMLQPWVSDELSKDTNLRNEFKDAYEYMEAKYENNGRDNLYY